MPKPFPQDVIPPERRSIRRIPLPEGKRLMSNIKMNVDSIRNFHKGLSGANLPKKILWIIAVLVLLTVLFLSFSLFSKAVISVVPKSEKINLDQDFVAYRNEHPGGGLIYQVMTLRKTDVKEALAIGEKRLEEKASGQIIIYNNYNSGQQRLIKNTRFETPEGLIYRIKDSITVPGKSSKGPGSVEATIYADLAGEKYNIDLADFTIPGFKGDPRYKFFYAKSKTRMAGGFAGTVKEVSAEERAKIIASLHEKLTAELQTEAKESKPDGYVIFPSASQIEFESLPQEPISEDRVGLSEAAIFQGILFERSLLEKEIAKTLSTYDSSAITIPELESLVFSFSSASGVSPWNNSSISFHLKGDATVVWTIDTVKLKEALVGKSKIDSNKVFASFSSIERAGVTVWPWWQENIPQEPKKIRIKIDQPK